MHVDRARLRASLTIWSDKASDLIESGQQRSLSAGYRYRAELEAGVFRGERFDIRMVNIEGNHLAIVALPGSKARSSATRRMPQFCGNLLALIRSGGGNGGSMRLAGGRVAPRGTA